MKHDPAGTKERQSTAPRVLLGAMAFATLAASGAATADALKDGRIGYVLTERHWAVYETEEAAECPNGFNGGPREQFTKLFPEETDTVRTVMETRLMREGRQFHPTTAKEPFPFYEAQGPISFGLNLDGEIGPNDLQSPQGEKGIDNQLYRVIGCIASYRDNGSVWFFENDFMIGNTHNRWMIELTGVDDLTNDNEVTVTTYRGLDDLFTDATGKEFLAGGTQRIDKRWGKSFIEVVQGRIVDRVLTTESIDEIKIPWSNPSVAGGYHVLRGLRLRLELTPQAAEGMLAGYVDVAQFTHQLNTNTSTHHQSYGQLSSASEYRALKRLADGYPDTESGANTAISAAVNVTLTQVYVMHPQEDIKSVQVHLTQPYRDY